MPCRATPRHASTSSLKRVGGCRRVVNGENKWSELNAFRNLRSPEYYFHNLLPTAVTAKVLRSPKRQVAFCQAVQKACPIGTGRPFLFPAATASSLACVLSSSNALLLCYAAAHQQHAHLDFLSARSPTSSLLDCAGAYIQPEPAATPGYASDIIFANGTFIEGSTAELSADGPLRPPFVVYCQGGTHWTHWAIALESAVEALRGMPTDAEEVEAEEKEAKRKAAAAEAKAAAKAAAEAKR